MVLVLVLVVVRSGRRAVYALCTSALHRNGRNPRQPETETVEKGPTLTAQPNPTDLCLELEQIYFSALPYAVVPAWIGAVYGTMNPFLEPVSP